MLRAARPLCDSGACHFKIALSHFYSVWRFITISCVMRLAVSLQQQNLFTKESHLHLMPLLRGGSRQNIAIMCGMKKSRTAGLPDGENCLSMFIRFDMVHERDRQIYRRV